jgi:hypothetical protein
LVLLTDQGDKAYTLSESEAKTLVDTKELTKEINGVITKFTIDTDGSLKITSDNVTTTFGADSAEMKALTDMAKGLTGENNAFVVAMKGKVISLSSAEYQDMLSGAVLEKDGTKFKLNDAGDLLISDTAGKWVQLPESA